MTKRAVKPTPKFFVIYHDCNAKKIEFVDIFERFLRTERIIGQLKKAIKAKKIKTREEFDEQLKTELLCFWSKSEFEVIVKEWIGPAAEAKIDIYTQIMANFHLFSDMMWEYLHG